MERTVLCYSCFHEFEARFGVCPNCGAVYSKEPVEAIHLRPGTLLGKRYLIGQAVSSGGFGIIYRAWDTKLDAIVAVKEFFANRMMTRAPGETQVIVTRKSKAEFDYRKERFLAEARNMAKFSNHKNIPTVYEFFEENGTAYIVMELLQGEDLRDYLNSHGGKIEQGFAIMIANEIGNALSALHEKGIIHRDVAPDNIYLNSRDGLQIMLLDLGAAKLADTTDDVIDIVLKPGYSPVEQYDNTDSIGTWTDVYSLGATMYAMLTGIKPEESTNRKEAVNRKEEDPVVPPHEIDPTIPENLSNAIMKAMAIQRNLRFKNVNDFLKAINGEKKVLSLKREKRRRARNRYIGISCAVLALGFLISYVYHMYTDKRSVQVLPDSSISVWYAVKEGSTEKAAMDSVLADFREKFPNVEISSEAIPIDEYEPRLRQALDRGALPTLFESTGLPEDLLVKTADLSEILQSEQAASCLFLDQYSSCYPGNRQIPLAIEVPVAYVITSGNTYVDYDAASFASLSDFGDGTAIAVDPEHDRIPRLNFQLSDSADAKGFWDNEANSCAVLLSTNMAANKVRETLTSYEKRFVYYAAKGTRCCFDYEWSIGVDSGAEHTAAVRLLSWMLGNNYQNLLMISRCSDGQIPINKTCFGAKTSQSNYAALDDIYSNYTFVRQEDAS